MMIVGLVGVFALGALVLASGAAAGQTPPADEPESYRSENYRSRTPAKLRGARVVSTMAAQAIWSEGSAAFIDVLPNFPPPPDLPAGTLWGVNNDSTFREARGFRIRGTARFRRQRKVI